MLDEIAEKLKRRSAAVLRKRCPEKIIDQIDQKTKHLCNKKITYIVYCFNKDKSIYYLNACCNEHVKVASMLEERDSKEGRYIKIQPLIEI